MDHLATKKINDLIRYVWRQDSQIQLHRIPNNLHRYSPISNSKSNRSRLIAQQKKVSILRWSPFHSWDFLCSKVLSINCFCQKKNYFIFTYILDHSLTHSGLIIWMGIIVKGETSHFTPRNNGYMVDWCLSCLFTVKTLKSSAFHFKLAN